MLPAKRLSTERDRVLPLGEISSLDDLEPRIISFARRVVVVTLKDVDKVVIGKNDDLPSLVKVIKRFL